MKNRNAQDEEPQGNNSKINMKKKQKNMKRIGGTGLSLETFANLKSTRSQYNPSLIKKQREFYKNAKYVKKYKKALKQQSQPGSSSDARYLEGGNEAGEGSSMNRKNRQKKGLHSLKDTYEKKHEEMEKARLEREAILKAKEEEREKAEVRRKAMREKMFKKTRFGQPIMKYRIEHLLDTIQSSADN